MLQTPFQHPNYDPSKFHNDIAVLRLAYPVQISDTIQPAKLLNLNNKLFQNVNAIGWGSRGNWERSSNKLLEVRLVIRAPQECIQRYPFNQATELCAGGDEYQDTCKGDSGGGLYYVDASYQKHLIGITSHGYFN